MAKIISATRRLSTKLVFLGLIGLLVSCGQEQTLKAEDNTSTQSVINDRSDGADTLLEDAQDESVADKPTNPEVKDPPEESTDDPTDKANNNADTETTEIPDETISDKPAKPAPKNQPAEFSGDLTGNVTLQDVLITGKANISDTDESEGYFLPQSTALYGEFNIDQMGNWSYELNPSHEAFNDWTSSDDSTTDVIRLLSIDGSEASLVITITGIDSPVTDETTEQQDPSEETATSDPQRIKPELHFWVVTSNYMPSVSYDVSDEDLQEYVRQANLIWDIADIEFQIKTINRIEMSDTMAIELDEWLKTTAISDRDREKRFHVLESTKQFEPVINGFNIVLMKEWGPVVGNAHLQSDTIFLAEKNARGEIRRHTILAHELGHTLALAHVHLGNASCNLMEAGLCGGFNHKYMNDGLLIKTLDPCQIEIARAQAEMGVAIGVDRSSASCMETK